MTFDSPKASEGGSGPEEEFEATRLALRRLTTNVLAGEARVTEEP